MKIELIRWMEVMNPLKCLLFVSVSIDSIGSVQRHLMKDRTLSNNRCVPVFIHICVT